MVHVLGLLSRAGHGKTTIARHLQEKYGVEIVSLASPLKKIAKAVMGFSDSQLYGTQAQKEEVLAGGARSADGVDLSCRIFLQKLGTEGLRENMGQDIFCEALAHNVAKDFLSKKPANGNADRDAVYAVDDARFLSEVAFINGLDQRNQSPRMFGHVIKIVCTDAPPSGNDNHPSERQIDEVQGYDIAGTVVSSRAQGVTHLIREFENVLTATRLAGLRVALYDALWARAKT